MGKSGFGGCQEYGTCLTDYVVPSAKFGGGEITVWEAFRSWARLLSFSERIS